MMRLDLFHLFNIRLGEIPKGHPVGYHALDYENLGAPPEDLASAADVTAKAGQRVAEEYEQHLDHCGYDQEDGGDFIDDSDQTAAALQVRNANRHNTVLTGFYVNRGKIATTETQTSPSPKSSRSSSHRQSTQSGKKATTHDIEVLLAELKQKAAAIQKKREREGSKAGVLRKIPQELDKCLVGSENLLFTPLLSDHVLGGVIMFWYFL